jgi:hypothetical protein
VDFLPDELVLYDVDEFVPDEFVLDDVPAETSVGFAGPSDMPPPHPATTPSPGSWRPHARATHDPKRSVRVGWIATGLASVFGLVAIARLVAAMHSWPAAPAAMHPPPAAPFDTTTPVSSDLLPSLSSAAANEQASPALPSPSTDAVELKTHAQEALEKGKLGAALDLGQQAVDADPTDAESWLILGATYLQRGRYKDARKCFARCVDQATQGPVSECKALLR